MQCVMKGVRWLAVLGCAGLQWASAAPITAPSQTETPTEAPTADESRRSDIGPTRGLRNEAQRPAERTVSSDVSTGQKNLDLLLELEGRPGSANGSTNGSATDEARHEAARAARKRLLESGAPAPEKATTTPGSGNKALMAAPAAGTDGDMNESGRDPATEGRRWSGNVGAPGANQDSSSAGDTPGHREFSDGTNFSQAPTRRLLLLLQEYREWLIAGAVAAALLALASGAASRTRRRR